MKIKSYTPFILGSIGVVLLGVFFLYKFDYDLKTACVIEPSKRFEIRAPDPGDFGGSFVDQLCVAEGQRVKQGDVIAVLTNLKLEGSIAEQRTQIATVEKQIVEARGRGDQNAVNQAVMEKKKAEEVLARYEAIRDELAIQAPFAGTVLIPEGSKANEQADRRGILALKKGSFVMPGETICSVSNTDEVMVYAVVHHSDIAQVQPPREGQPGARVSLRMYSYPDRTFTGAVFKKPQAYQEFIRNPVLLHPFGGEVVVKGSGEPVGHFFVVNISIDNPEGALIPGMTGWAKIHAGKRTLSQRLWLFLRQKTRILFRHG